MAFPHTTREIKYLGHIISGEGVATDKEKVHCIQAWPTPSNVSEVRQLLEFLGLCSYYRRFIAHFANIAQPLYQCTEKSRNFHWTSETEKAFQTLKQILASAPVLGFPHPEGHILYTDASAHAIGAVLSQVKQGEESLVLHYSTKPELHYCTTRRAVVKSIGQFHHYLCGRWLTVRTDNAALKWLMNFRQPEGQVA
jgi:hypothetical protein